MREKKTTWLPWLLGFLVMASPWLMAAGGWADIVTNFMATRLDPNMRGSPATDQYVPTYDDASKSYILKVGGGGITGINAGTNITITGPTTNPTISASGSGGVTTFSAGAGISGAIVGATLGITNTGVTAINAGTNITLSGPSGSPTITAVGPVAGTGISVAGTTITNTGVLGLIAGTNVTLTGPSSNPTISAAAAGVSSVMAGAGISVGASGGTVTVTNTGGVNAGTGISVSGPTTNPTVTNTGIISLVAGTGIGVSGSTISNTGVTSLNAGTNITLTGPSSSPTITASSGTFSGDVNTTTNKYLSSGGTGNNLPIRGPINFQNSAGTNNATATVTAAGVLALNGGQTFATDNITNSSAATNLVIGSAGTINLAPTPGDGVQISAGNFLAVDLIVAATVSGDLTLEPQASGGHVKVPANDIMQADTFQGVTTNGTTTIKGNGTGNLAVGASGLVFPNNAGAPTVAGQTLRNANDLQFFNTASRNLLDDEFHPVMQLFAASGTYTPTANTLFCKMFTVGGGGGGGGCSGSAAYFLIAGGGGAGGWAEKWVVGPTAQTVTIGAAGAASSSGLNPGGNGGDTSIGSLCIGKGGTGGAGLGSGNLPAGGLGGVAGTGDITRAGEHGHPGINFTNSSSTLLQASGNGGDSVLGIGGLGAYVSTGSAANGTAPVSGYGGGGGGACCNFDTTTTAGAAGNIGYAYVIDYVRR